MEQTNISVNAACVTGPNCLQSKDSIITKDRIWRTEFLLAVNMKECDVCILKKNHPGMVRKTSVDGWLTKQKLSFLGNTQFFHEWTREGRLWEQGSTPFSSAQYAQQRPWSYTATPPCLQAWQLEVGQGSRSLGQYLTKRKWKATEKKGGRHMNPGPSIHSTNLTCHLQWKLFSSLKQPCNKVVIKTALSRIFNLFYDKSKCTYSVVKPISKSKLSLFHAISRLSCLMCVIK